jgi:acetyl-CoA/propionyl-CoA carboxylase biotin carboxyl carrier protein
VESDELARRAGELDAARSAAIAATSDGRGTASSLRQQLISVEIDGRRHEVRIHAPEPPWAEVARRHKARSKGIASEATGAVASPMQGVVLSVAVGVGDAIGAGELICVVEAMKMENELVAHRDGVVAALHVTPGQQVALGDVVCVIDAP